MMLSRYSGVTCLVCSEEEFLRCVGNVMHAGTCCMACALEGSNLELLSRSGPSDVHVRVDTKN